MILLWVGLIFGIIYLFRDKIPMDSPRKKDDLEELLKKRYVAGEINEETYLRMKKELNF